MGSTFIGSPVARHAVAEESDSRQLGHRLDDVEVTERADLEEGHVVLCGEVLRVRLAHFASEGKVQTVANQDLGNARCVLTYKSNSHTHYHLSAKTLETVECVYFKMEYGLTSSTSFNQRSMPSNDHLLVMSYTKRIPCAPREYERKIVQKRP